jgi:hypothetical protein
MNTPRGDIAAIEDRWRRQIEAYHEAALLYAAVKLGLPERMEARAWTAEALARALVLSAPHLLRFLRGLAAIGVCEEQPDGIFTLSPAGHALKMGSPSRLAEKVTIVVEQYWQPWANLLHSLQTGGPAFEAVFGTDVRDWRRAHAQQGALFDSYLAKETLAHAAPIVDALDVSGVTTIAEIGGGYGGLLAALLHAHPQTRGILFDQPHRVEAARSFLQVQDAPERIRLVAGDMLTAIQVEADLYLLNGVLRQFGDEDCAAILRNLRGAMPEGSRLVMIERTLPDRAADDPAAVMLDLQMMAISGGRVRTRHELEELLTRAGFAVSSVTPRSGLTIIDAK